MDCRSFLVKNLKSLKLRETSKNQLFGFKNYMKRAKNTFLVTLHVFMNFICFVENHDF